MTEFDLTDLYTQLYGYVAPPFPTAGNLADQLQPSNPFTAISANLDQYQKTALNVEMILPLKLSIPDFEYTFPIEPIINISGGHTVIRRYPNRPSGLGSHKERWAKMDYEISVKGIMLDLKDENYPADQITSLRRFLDYEGSIQAENTLFRLFGFEYIVITNFDLPFTEGKAMQEYAFNGLSDQLFNSLLTAL